MAGYGWDEYDVRTGGIQTIKDAGNLLDVTTSFVKIPGGIHGGSWAVRVKGVPRAGAAPDSKFTVVFYASLEGLGSVGVSGAIDPLGFEGDVTLEGESEGLGKYKMVVTKGTGKHPAQRHISYDEKPLDRTIVHSLAVPEEYIWQAKSVMFSEIKKEVDRYLATYGQMNPPPPEQVYTMSNMVGPGNFHLVQKVFEGAFEFDVLFTSASASEEVTSQTLTDGIQKLDKSFTERFKEVFKLKAPFDQPQYLGFAKSMFSNLFGGIGYFYGDSVVDRSYASEYDEENEGFWEETEQARALKREKLEGPSELFTSIPSRPFFPRGFLWDEGFHLIPIVDWDMDVALEIVRSWFHLMDQDGWIGREQILGEEARSKVPPEFQVQYPHYANPPTLFFILETFIDRLSAANGTGPAAEPMIGAHTPEIQTAHVDNPEVAQQYLRELYPLLQRQFAWFRRTQSGDLKSYDRDAFSSREAYRWRGRTVQHILTSGLDDYPRAAVPHPGELHVDLISWMGMMSRSLKRIASFLEEEDDARSYAKIENAIARNVDDLHWSEKEGMYCDATIDDFEESVHVCHKGYISLFPFLLGLLPYDSPKLGKVLDLMADPEHLWSEFGLRSLSKSDPLYGTAENYWRGPVWVNVNYLAVRESCVSLSFLVDACVSPSCMLTATTETRRVPNIPLRQEGEGLI
jgi:mannosyl-oligosaccharide glucosidase